MIGEWAATTKDTTRQLRPLTDLLKGIEEIKTMRNRLYSLDVARLEEQNRAMLEAAMAAALKRAKPHCPEESDRLREEARRVVMAEHERSKEILAVKFQRLDASLQALTGFLQTVGPIKEAEARLEQREEKLRKAEEEVDIQKKVTAKLQEELERDWGLLKAGEEALVRKEREVHAKLLHLDVVQRAKELDQRKEDLDGKLKAYELEVAGLVKQRETLDKDGKNLGQIQAALDKQREQLEAERLRLAREKEDMASAVAREMAGTFEAHIRDLIRSPRTCKT